MRCLPVGAAWGRALAKAVPARSASLRPRAWQSPPCGRGVPRPELAPVVPRWSEPRETGVTPCGGRAGVSAPSPLCSDKRGFQPLNSRRSVGASSPPRGGWTRRLRAAWVARSAKSPSLWRVFWALFYTSRKVPPPAGRPAIRPARRRKKSQKQERITDSFLFDLLHSFQALTPAPDLSPPLRPPPSVSFPGKI